ncbi:hypothetical protein BZA77DRAFT_305697 [Pyronema omphalodes]|nr:hypothetical protein BZA77DRAFT_305697 [Pyronema omphalodes]
MPVSWYISGFIFGILGMFGESGTSGTIGWRWISGLDGWIVSSLIGWGVTRLTTRCLSLSLEGLHTLCSVSISFFSSWF